MEIRLIGDVHGYYQRYKKIIKQVDNSIQLGDMGVGFKALRQGEVKYLKNPPFDAMSKGNHLFIRGNHDNPEVCKKHKYWIPDGTYLYDKIFCVGGAKSIDRVFRTEGWDWWPEEELSYEELDKIIQKYIEIKPDYVVSHECPNSIANEILQAFNRSKIEDGSRTRQALEVMFYHHKPKRWWFGHWHESLEFKSGGTQFRCLNELEYEDYEF